MTVRFSHCHVLLAGYDVKYFQDKGLGLKTVYVTWAVVLVKLVGDRFIYSLPDALN